MPSDLPKQQKLLKTTKLNLESHTALLKAL